MPYLHHSWAKKIQESDVGGADKKDSGEASASESGGSKTGRVLRTVPADEKNKDNPSSGEPEAKELNKDQMLRLQCMANIVRSQVEEMVNMEAPAQSTEDPNFFRYTIKVDLVMFCGKYSNIYLAHHNDNPEQPLIGRVFEPSSKINPQSSTTLKILKLIGKRCEHLISTWDVFFDANARVVIFQEFAQYGNLQEYLKQNNVMIPEPNMQEWAQQLYKGMDFLGDAGICHRSINPKHILLLPAPEDPNQIRVKLGSFRDAIVYFDPKNGSVRKQTCRPLEKRMLANYQAPEVFGSPSAEEYDPIMADIWSYGATLFLAANRVYPYRYKENPPDIAADIQKTIDSSTSLSEEAKRWFSGLLAGDANKRTPFDKIAADPWFKQPVEQQQQQQQQQQAPPLQPQPVSEQEK